MRPLPTFALALLVSASAASAQSPPPAPARAPRPAAAPPGAIRPGTYDLDVAFGGGSIPGTLRLVPAGDSLAATLHVGEHTPPVRSVTRTGARLVLDAGDEGMRLVYDFRFRGDSVSGTFTLNGDEGLVSGARRK